MYMISHHTSSTILGSPRFQEGTRPAKDKTGEAWSRKTCDEWDLPGKRRRWQLSTDQNGVGVWPNTFTWTWDESSQVQYMIYSDNRENAAGALYRVTWIMKPVCF